MSAAISALPAAFAVVAMTFVNGCASRDEAAKPDRSETPAAASISGIATMTENKRTVESYLDGFRTSDHEQVLSCLTEDVEWEIPGMFHVTGKDAFDKEIENEAFVGRPVITTSRMTEENDVVVAEGAVRAEKKEGGALNVKFCDVFEMREGKIKRLISYLVEVK